MERNSSQVSCSRRNSWLTCLMPRHRSYMADCCMRSLKKQRKIEKREEGGRGTRQKKILSFTKSISPVLGSISDNPPSVLAHLFIYPLIRIFFFFIFIHFLIPFLPHQLSPVKQYFHTVQRRILLVWAKSRIPNPPRLQSAAYSITAQMHHFSKAVADYEKTPHSTLVTIETFLRSSVCNFQHIYVDRNDTHMNICQLHGDAHVYQTGLCASTRRKIYIMKCMRRLRMPVAPDTFSLAFSLTHTFYQQNNLGYVTGFTKTGKKHQEGKKHEPIRNVHCRCHRFTGISGFICHFSLL